MLNIKLWHSEDVSMAIISLDTEWIKCVHKCTM